MKTIFDMLAILSGIIGLGSIAFAATNLTPENAGMQSARVMIVIAFVLVSFLVARALEKTEIKLPSIRLMPARKRPVLLENKSASVQTPYFDYLFQADMSSEWSPSTASQVPATKSVGDARTSVK